MGPKTAAGNSRAAPTPGGASFRVVSVLPARRDWSIFSDGARLVSRSELFELVFFNPSRGKMEVWESTFFSET